jgi:integrase
MSSPTLGDYLGDWLEVQRSQLAPTTVFSYQGTITRYILPHLGAVPLDQLTVGQLNTHYARLLREGGRGGKRLSVRSVRYAHQIIHKALSDAVRDGRLDRNVARHATVPTRDPDREEPAREPRVWTAEQLAEFFALTTDEPLRSLWVLAATTGMRRGELLGLRWEDVDLGSRTVHVRRALAQVGDRIILKTPKTNQARALKIDPATARMLAERADEQDRDRRAAGDGWADRWGLVFTAPDGQPLNPLWVTVRFRRIVARLPLPALSLHGLRHSHATLLLQAGVPIKVVSARLGHAEIQMTLDLYTHVLPAMDEDAVAGFTELVDLDRALGSKPDESSDNGEV